MNKDKYCVNILCTPLQMSSYTVHVTAYFVCLARKSYMRDQHLSVSSPSVSLQ